MTVGMMMGMMGMDVVRIAASLSVCTGSRVLVTEADMAS